MAIGFPGFNASKKVFLPLLAVRNITGPSILCCFYFTIIPSNSQLRFLTECAHNALHFHRRHQISVHAAQSERTCSQPQDLRLICVLRKRQLETLRLGVAYDDKSLLYRHILFQQVLISMEPTNAPLVKTVQHCRRMTAVIRYDEMHFMASMNIVQDLNLVVIKCCRNGSFVRLFGILLPNCCSFLLQILQFVRNFRVFWH